MPIEIASIQGCCVGQNFYNLGGAHGHMTAKDQDQFNEWLSQKTGSGINIAITNSQQNKTRDYLIKAGWDTKKVGSLYISTISATDFATFKSRARAEIEAKKKVAAEERKKKEEERLKHIANVKFSYNATQKNEPLPPPTATTPPLVRPSPQIRDGIYRGIVYEEQIRRLYVFHPTPRNQNVDTFGTAMRINTFYGTRIPTRRVWRDPASTRRNVYEAIHQQRLTERVNRRTLRGPIHE